MLGDEFVSGSLLKHASVAILAREVHSATTILNYNSSVSITPASTQKLLISAVALEIFGPDHTFLTELQYDGYIDKAGTLIGNLYIHGGGDPALGSSLFNEHYGDIIRTFARSVKQAGIHKINGNVIGDGALFGEIRIPDNWIWEDIGNYYGSPANGLSIYDNTYKIFLQTRNTAGTPSLVKKIDPPIPNIEFMNEVTAADDTRDNAYIYGTWLSDRRIIRGTIPKGRDEFVIKGSVPDPAYLVASELINHLDQEGIIVNGKPQSLYHHTDKKSRKHLFTQKSPPLSDIITQLNRRSINLYAETLLLHLALANNAEASTEQGSAHLKSFWEDHEINTGGMSLFDGSGLSLKNKLTVECLVGILQFMKTQSNHSEVFLNSLPVAGVSGSMKSFGKGTILKNNFRAKSGYMTGVMGYAGYLTTASGKELVIAVIVNNYTCSDSEMKKAIEGFLVEVSEHIGALE